MNMGTLIFSNEYADVYRDGDRKIKLFKDNVPKTYVLYEALTHSRIEAAEISIPKLFEVSVINGRWAIITEYIEGKTYAELIKENPEKIDLYLDELAEIQIEIHCTPAPKQSKLKDKLQRLITEMTEIDEIKKYELLTRLEGMPAHSKLCHLNYIPENVISSEKGIYILDWHNARQGNASADVANTYVILSLKSAEMAEKYIDLFCDKTLTPKDYVQQWIPIVAVARYGFADANEKERLMKMIDVVSYE